MLAPVALTPAPEPVAVAPPPHLSRAETLLARLDGWAAKHLRERRATLGLARNKLTRVNFDELEDSELCTAAESEAGNVTEFVFGWMNATGKAGLSYAEGLELLPPHWRRVYVCSFLARNVWNGGIAQFFWNSRSQYNADLVADLRAIGAPEAAAVMEKAIAIHDRRADAKRAADASRDGVPEWMKAFTEVAAEKPYDSLDLDHRRLQAQLAAYIRAHPELYCSGPAR